MEYTSLLSFCGEKVAQESLQCAHDMSCKRFLWGCTGLVCSDVGTDETCFPQNTSVLGPKTHLFWAHMFWGVKTHMFRGVFWAVLGETCLVCLFVMRELRKKARDSLITRVARVAQESPRLSHAVQNDKRDHKMTKET